jgi:adenylate cyclase
VSDEDLLSRIDELERENARLRETISTYDRTVRSTVSPYVTDEVYHEIWNGQTGEMIVGERRVVTMMFTDLRGSTELSETLSPTDFMSLLNHYLGDMIEIINAWEGNILSFVGDAIVVVFGAPRPNDQAARQAVASAVSMQRRMPYINKWGANRGYPALSMGIGIHTGEAILGNVGSEVRMKYDMIGRNVNLAARIEGFTRGGQILVSTETLEAAGDGVRENVEGACWVRPKGIRDPVLVHDIVGMGKRLIPNA